MHILSNLKFSAQKKKKRNEYNNYVIFGTVYCKTTLKISIIISRLITQKLLLKISNILVFATICYRLLVGYLGECAINGPSRGLIVPRVITH